jgi:hypothetical protein
VEYWVLEIWMIGFIGKNLLQEEYKNRIFTSYPIIPSFHCSNWGEAPKLRLGIS